MVAVVVNIIRGGGKVKKNIREEKGKRGLASSHELKPGLTQVEKLSALQTLLLVLFISIISIPTNPTTINN